MGLAPCAPSLYEREFLIGNQRPALSFASNGKTPKAILSGRLPAVVQNWGKWWLLAAQGLLAWCAVAAALWAELPRLAVAGAGLLAAAAIVATAALKLGRISRAAIGVAWVGTLLVIAGLALGWQKPFTLEVYDAALAWAVAAVLLPGAMFGGEDSSRRRWRVLAMTWLMFGGLLALAGAYQENLAFLFYLALIFNLGLLLLLKRWFRLGPPATELVNTLVLVIIGLPVVDLFIRPSYQLDARPETSINYHSYEAARRDPVAFARWWDLYQDQWSLMAGQVFQPDPSGLFPIRTRPNTQGHFFQGLITINSRGFRGPEIPEPKGNAYRIVALGESTTFDCTMNPQEKPWPELLEQMIRERLHPGCPVQVINAGVPAYNLKHNDQRLVAEILPLKPDMIISYHGYNGWGLLGGGQPPIYGRRPPAYQQRPLKLLASAEHHLRMLGYRKTNTPKLFPLSFDNLMETEYARAYEQLAECARTNHIRLVVGNFSMAVNGDSPADVIEFYRAGFPSVQWDIRANQAHSLLVGQITREHPEICPVDTHPGLDGEHEKFLDLVHFTQTGRQQLAENMFAGITNALEQDWSRPRDNPSDK